MSCGKLGYDAAVQWLLLGYFEYFLSHEWQKSGRFYIDIRNKSSRETCVFSASTTVAKLY